MSRHTVSLKPFQSLLPLQLSLDCEIIRAGETVHLTYRLTGAIEQVVLPQKKAAATNLRLDDLWRSTCFECFCQATNSEGYHEINLTPAGDWNVYIFDGYRSGMRKEARITSLQQVSQSSADSFILKLSIPLACLELAELPLRLGLSAVLEHVDTSVSYWAPVHPGERPDFHNQSGFIVEI